ncbi:MAG TPA: PKD domain-containing protein [Terriglobales bacterium]|nr:PKD domain-containing protein [Terriglobales bacterium]
MASNKEEEVFGSITSTDHAWTVSLTARDQATTNNQAVYDTTREPVNFGLQTCTQGGTGHENAHAQWGWYGFGPSFDPQCVDPLDSTRNEPEHHRTEGADFTRRYEAHCVNGGRFTVTLSKAEQVTFKREVDFIAYVHTPTFKVEDTTQVSAAPQLGYSTDDVIVDVVDGSGDSATPVTEVSATVNAYDPTWTSLAPQQGVYHMPANFWARFRSSGSVPSGGYALTRLLVRYFWNSTLDLNDRSGFGNPVDVAPTPLIRVHRFAQGSPTVRMHLVQPNEHPIPPTDPTDATATNYGALLDLTFAIYAPLDVSIVLNPTNVVVLNPVQLSDAGSNGAGSNTYQWDFGDGSSLSTVASPSHTYTTPGTKTVTLTKGDHYGFISTGRSRISVTDPPPTNLVASNVTSSGATIGWTIGNPAANTTIQQRLSGTATWVTAGTVGPTINSLALTGLSSCTSYDVNAFHVNAATAALSLFRTTGGNSACAPSNFTLVSCSDTTIKGTAYRSYYVAWTRGEFSTGSTYEIGQANTNDSGGATVIKSGPSAKTGAVLGPYSRSQSQLLYFWVRHKLSGGTGPSAWVLLDNAPENPSGACF